MKKINADKQQEQGVSDMKQAGLPPRRRSGGKKPGGDCALREAENEDERQIGSRRKTGGKDSSPDESRLKKQSPEYVDDLDEDAETELADPEILPSEEELLDELAPQSLDAGLLESPPVIDLLPPGGEGDLPVPSSVRLPSLSTRDNLQLYLREVSRFPLLAPDEEVELARRVRDTGDSDAAFRIMS